MALSELEIARVRRVVGSFVEEKRPPPHLRTKVDLAFRITRQSVEIFEIRRALLGPPGRTLEEPVAKATFVRTTGLWRVFWMRRDLKWHGYPPAPEVRSIEEFVQLVRMDECACFFG